MSKRKKIVLIVIVLFVIFCAWQTQHIEFYAKDYSHIEYSRLCFPHEVMEGYYRDAENYLCLSEYTWWTDTPEEEQHYQIRLKILGWVLDYDK